MMDPGVVVLAESGRDGAYIFKLVQEMNGQKYAILAYGHNGKLEYSLSNKLGTSALVSSWESNINWFPTSGNLLHKTRNFTRGEIFDRFKEKIREILE